tara:strand:+ start:2635 stop:3012 length:378 start_codon:yes stop_codon:yes gene_type:complete
MTEVNYSEMLEGEIREGLEKFIESINTIRMEAFTRRGMTHLIDPEEGEVARGNVARLHGPGRVYWRIATGLPGRERVHCFVRKCDGAILKSATWKAPATNIVRGYVTDDDNGASAVNEYGANYAI